MAGSYSNMGNSKAKDKLSVVCSRGVALVDSTISGLDPTDKKKSEGRRNVLRE